MKIYEVIETTCYNGVYEGTDTEIFLNRNDAKAYFESRADAFESQTREEFNSIGTDDSNCDCVIQRNENHFECWESWNAMNWWLIIKLKEYDIER